MIPTREQVDGVEKFRTGKSLKVKAFAGTGKALRNDQPVLTPSGYVEISTLKEGDLVIGRDGLPHKVLGVFPQGVRKMFRLEMSDGIAVIADADHIWTVQRVDHRRTGRFVNRTTAQLAEKQRTPNGPAAKYKGTGDRSYWFFPMCEPIEFGVKATLPIDPWMLGALLGNGTMSESTNFSSADKDTLNLVESHASSLGLKMRHNGGYDYRLTFRVAQKGEFGVKNALGEEIKSLGLRDKKSWEKFIPSDYKFASPDDRLALLQGLFDTDGHAMGPAVEYTTTSQDLSRDVEFVVHSLGGTIVTSEKIPTIDGVPHRKAYRSYIKLPDSMPPFKCERKLSGMAREKQRPPYRSLVSITECGEAEATCISVDAPDKLFLTAGCLPTHNTSGLVQIAKSTNRRGVYFAFNKAIAEDAKTKFPRTVTCMTTHSLAYRAMVSTYSTDKMMGNINAGLVAKQLNLLAREVSHGVELSARGLGFLIAETVKNFMRSGSTSLSTWNVPKAEGALATIPEEDWEVLRKFIAKRAEEIWKLAIDPKSRFPLSHDGYLKAYALSEPQIAADYILLDEAQDTNGVVLSIVNRQKAQIALVGDEYQQLYEWRGAHNAMDSVDTTNESYLTKSFRFGPEIAGLASRTLRLLGEDRPLVGNEKIESRISPIESPSCILSRTNAGLIEEVMSHLDRDIRPYVVGGTDDFGRFLDGADKLMDGRSTEHPDLIGFSSWGDVVYASERPEGADLRSWVKIIAAHGTDKLRQAFDSMPRSEASADIILSTGHRAKGREWDKVRLLGNFLMGVKTENTKTEGDARGRQGGLLSSDEPERGNCSDAELRLFYVAATRAKQQLDVAPELMEKYEKVAETRGERSSKHLSEAAQ